VGGLNKGKGGINFKMNSKKETKDIYSNKRLEK
jgi:hypothetical protein